MRLEDVREAIRWFHDVEVHLDVDEGDAAISILDRQSGSVLSRMGLDAYKAVNAAQRVRALRLTQLPHVRAGDLPGAIAELVSATSKIGEEEGYLSKALRSLLSSELSICTMLYNAPGQIEMSLGSARAAVRWACEYLDGLQNEGRDTEPGDIVLRAVARYNVALALSHLHRDEEAIREFEDLRGELKGPGTYLPAVVNHSLSAVREAERKMELSRSSEARQLLEGAMNELGTVAESGKVITSLRDEAGILLSEALVRLHRLDAAYQHLIQCSPGSTRLQVNRDLALAQCYQTGAALIGARPGNPHVTQFLEDASASSRESLLEDAKRTLDRALSSCESSPFLKMRVLGLKLTCLADCGCWRDSLLELKQIDDEPTLDLMERLCNVLERMRKSGEPPAVSQGELSGVASSLGLGQISTLEALEEMALREAKRLADERGLPRLASRYHGRLSTFGRGPKLDAGDSEFLSSCKANLFFSTRLFSESTLKRMVNGQYESFREALGVNRTADSVGQGGESQRSLKASPQADGSNVPVLVILRRWSSYTPALSRRAWASKGGGYFVRVRGQSRLLGIAVDPGHDFLENLLHEGFRIRDIDGILVTHSHPDHSDDLIPCLTLVHELNAALSDEEKHKVTIVLSPGAYKEFIDQIEDRREDVFDTVRIDNPRLGTTMEVPVVFATGDELRLAVTANAHVDLSHYPAVGVIIPANAASNAPSVGFVGDTGWSEDVVSQYATCAVVCGHVGSIRARNDDSIETAFARLLDEKNDEIPHHLYLPGTILALRRLLAPCKNGSESKLLVVLSEFGEELKGGLRTDLVERIRSLSVCDRKSHPDNCSRCSFGNHEEPSSPEAPLRAVVGDVGLRVRIDGDPSIWCIACREFVPVTDIRAIAYGPEEALFYVCRNCEEYRYSPFQIRDVIESHYSEGYSAGERL